MDIAADFRRKDMSIGKEIHRLQNILDCDSPTGTGAVFVDQNGASERRQVEPGLSQESAVEIIGGLNEGEFVVTAGQHSLQDGERVTMVKP